MTRSQQPQVIHLESLLKKRQKSGGKQSPKASKRRGNHNLESSVDFLAPQQSQENVPAWGTSANSGLQTGEAGEVKNSQSEDFQSLLQCFPHLGIEDIFPLYLQVRLKKS